MRTIVSSLRISKLFGPIFMFFLHLHGSHLPFHPATTVVIFFASTSIALVKVSAFLANICTFKGIKAVGGIMSYQEEHLLK